MTHASPVGCHRWTIGGLLDQATKNLIFKRGAAAEKRCSLGLKGVWDEPLVGDAPKITGAEGQSGLDRVVLDQACEANNLGRGSVPRIPNPIRWGFGRFQAKTDRLWESG